MPLSINVGLSRKASKDYQSTGVSINVNAELDQSLLARPEELQRQIDELYAQAAEAIDRQVRACSAAAEPPRDDRRGDREPRGPRNGRQPSQPRNGHRQSNGRGDARNGTGGNGHGHGNSSGGGGMTGSQRRAIDAIAGRLEINAADECSHEFGLDLDTLTVREASRLIDHLKTLQPAPAAGGNG